MRGEGLASTYSFDITMNLLVVGVLNRRHYLLLRIQTYHREAMKISYACGYLGTLLERKYMHY